MVLLSQRRVLCVGKTTLWMQGESDCRERKCMKIQGQRIGTYRDWGEAERGGKNTTVY